MSKVYVVQNQRRLNDRSGDLEPKFDMSSAEKFGELVELLSPTARPFGANSRLIADLHEKLRGYTSEDYLLLIGNPCLIGFVVAIAAMHNRGRVRVLQWDGRRKEYLPVDAFLGIPEREDDGLCGVVTFTREQVGTTCALRRGHSGRHYPTAQEAAIDRIKDALRGK